MTKRYRAQGSGKAVALAEPAPVNRPSTGRQSPKPTITRWNPYASHSDLTWPDIMSILRAAERGQTEQLADLTRRMLSSDDHLLSVYETRINAVAGARYKVTPGQGAKGTEEIARRAADDCARVIDALPNRERFFADILDGGFTGWAASELIWEPRGDEWRPVEAIWIHPRRTRFADDFSLFLYDDGQAALAAKEAGLETVSARGANGIALTPNKYVISVPRLVPNYPPVSGLALSVMRPWWVKLWVTKFWLQGSEIAGNPRVLGKYPAGAPEDVRDALFEALQGFAADGVAAFSQESAIELLAPMAQGTGSVWETFCKRCDAAMSKAILGSTLNVEVGDSGGNRSLGESQGDITMTPRFARDAKAMWAAIQRDVFRPFLMFNRHRYGGVMPPVPMGETILFEAKAEIDELIVSRGAVTINELRASRNLEPWSDGGDVRIAPDAAAPAQPAFSAEAPAARPLRASPWETAMRQATSAGSVVTPTSGPSLTTTSARVPSES